jgi:hypothetical protein
MSNSTLMSISDIISVFGGNSAFARAIGVGPSTASEMKRRGRIPAEYWRDLIGAARRIDHPEITAELLTELHARVPSRGAMPGFAEDNTAYKDDTDGGSTGDDDKKSATGHFSRHKHIRRDRFRTAGEIEEHICALREEWSRR